jgi:aspartate aminotransferase
MRLSKRALRIPEEPFFIALDLPPDVLRLSGGEPDFPSAEFVNKAAFEAVADGQTHYTPPAGIPSLREGIANKLKKENGLSYSPDQIVVTPGTSGAITLLLLSMIDPGEEVLLPDPAWFHYAALIELVGGVPKRVPLSPSDGFLLHASKLEEASTERTKALILNNPANPTGRVLKAQELEDVAGAAERLDLTVLSDEIYEKIVYRPNAHRSIASLSGMQDRVAVVNGFSKGYAMMGWRVGYVAAPAEMTRKLSPLLGYTLVCANSVAQHAAVEALTNPESDEYTRKMLGAWEKRRGIVMGHVAESDGAISADPPEGTFYGWLDVSGSGMDGKEAARRILKDARVGVMPGYLFGEQGKNHIRISFATSDAVVEEGMVKLCSVLAEGKKRVPVSPRRA